MGNGEIKHTTTGDGHELISAFARDAWGRGLGTELAQLIVAYSFDTLALDEVHATGAPPNAVSLTLLGRLGFPHVRDIAEDDGTTAQVLTLRR